MADRTLTINHADGGSETYTINRDKFAGVREMSRGHVYPTIASTDFDLTGVVFTKVDEETFTLVTNNSTDTRYVVFVNHENGIRTGKHRLAFDLTLNSGSLGTITGFYTDFDGDPSNGGSYGSYSLTEGSNVIDFEIFDDGVGASPEIIWAINTGSTFDISVTNLKVTHEPDTVTVDHTAPPESRIMFIDGNSITISRATGGDIRTITIDGQEITINRTRTVASHARAGSIYYAQGGFKFYQPDGQSLYLQP